MYIYYFKNLVLFFIWNSPALAVNRSHHPWYKRVFRSSRRLLLSSYFGPQSNFRWLVRFPPFRTMYRVDYRYTCNRNGGNGVSRRCWKPRVSRNLPANSKAGDGYRNQLEAQKGLVKNTSEKEDSKVALAWCCLLWYAVEVAQPSRSGRVDILPGCFPSW